MQLLLGSKKSSSAGESFYQSHFGVWLAGSECLSTSCLRRFHCSCICSSCSHCFYPTTTSGCYYTLTAVGAAASGLFSWSSFRLFINTNKITHTRTKYRTLINYQHGRRPLDSRLESSDYPTLVIGEDGIIINFNPAACTAFQLTQESVVGKNVSILMAIQNKLIIMTNTWKIIKTLE